MSLRANFLLISMVPKIILNSVRVSDPAVIRVCRSDTGLPFNGKRCLSSECLGVEVVVRATQPAYGDYIVVVRFIGVFHLLL
jgi:hypothetical protein